MSKKGICQQGQISALLWTPDLSQGKSALLPLQLPRLLFLVKPMTYEIYTCLLPSLVFDINQIGQGLIRSVSRQDNDIDMSSCYQMS